MFFEPSGVLRSDYGAYCHALGLTEREELYHSIFTNDEQRREKEAKYLETHLPSPVSPSYAVDDMSTADASQSPPPDPLISVTASPVAANNTISATSTPTASVAPKRTTSGVSTKGKKKSTMSEDAARLLADANPPTVTYIVMRQLKFCLNERDIKPLAFAIPYCVSLVSVELVGCGLSERSYFLLVEALYKSRRVASVTVDFNSTTRPGFYVDPTVLAPMRAKTPPPVAGISLLDPTQELSVSQLQLESSQESTRRSLPVGPTDVFEGFSVLRGSLSPVTTTFLPSDYRGLKSILFSQDPQSRDERGGRKGKVDSKKQSQVQQQLDSLAQIDRDNPVIVHYGWASMLLTGVKYLSLRGNGITNDDAIAMASLLLSHPRSELVSLNLWGNYIADDGAVAIAHMLKENRTLQALDLGHNHIGDRGLLSLVDCFRMQEVPQERVQVYRKRYLLRRDATARERQLGSTTPPMYPSYQELYAAWYQNKHPATTEEKKESKKGAQTKAKKTEPVLVRPTTPFDRDCFRMESGVRIPGNTVLRCVNLGNNYNVTLKGARESLRILSLHEPSDDKEMSELQNCAVEPPELYCCSLSLRNFVILHEGEPGLREVQKELSTMLHERLLLLPLPPPENEVADDSKRKSPRAKK